MAVDAAGNCYVTGQYAGTASFGPFTLTSVGSDNVFVAKYDSRGNVLWVRSVGGSSGFGIALDFAGNIYITGDFIGTATFGPFTLHSTGGSFDIFVAKYDSNGDVIWVRSDGGTGSEGVKGSAVDAAGNTYVTGWYQGTALFGQFTLPSAGSWDLFVAKYDGSGNLLWARSEGGIGLDDARGIAADSAGNSYVTGLYEDGAIFGPFTLTSAGSFDLFVAKYDAGGNVLWVQSTGGTANDAGLGIDVDTNGNSYVTGFYRQTATFGSFTLDSAIGPEIFVVKFDTGGNALWAQSAGGIFSDSGSRISVDDVGNTYVTGLHGDGATFGPFTLAGVSGLFVAKYDTGGNVNWVRSAGGNFSSEGPHGIGIDAAGNSYVSGTFRDFATFESHTLISSGGREIFVAKYNTCGDGSIDVGEVCDDGGESVTCDSDCTVVECGDGTLNGTAGEQCDGGLGCTGCLCDVDSEPTGPPSLDCQPICGNGTVDPGEECDGGLGCTNCLCDADFEPTAPLSLDCQPICGNGSIDPGEQCDGTDDAWCPGNCLSDCTCAPGTIIPAVSEWGVAVMALLMLAVGTVVVRRRVFARTAA